MTRTEKEQLIMEKLKHIEELSDVDVDILFGFLISGGDAK